MCDHTCSIIVLIMSILRGFVSNFVTRRILRILWCRLERINTIIIGHRKKHKTLSYISAMTVIGLRMRTTSAVCGSRGVQPGSLLRRTSLQIIPVEETILSVPALSRVLIPAAMSKTLLSHTNLPATWRARELHVA